MRTYLYPQNLKASANLWLWSLRDFLILSIAILISAVIDSIGYAVRFFISGQQYFEWRAK